MKALLRTGLLACLALLAAGRMQAQCTNSSQYPTGSTAINSSGVVTTISTCNFAGEYSVVTGAVAGQTLRFTYSLSGGFITVRSGSSSGPVVASGSSPLSFNNTFTGTLYVHWNTSAACGTNTTCSTTTVQCTSCSGSAGCNNGAQYPSSSFAINTGGSLVTISTCNFAGEYSVVTGAVAGQTLRFTYSLSGGFITVRSGSSSGPVVASGSSPLSFNNTFTGTLYVHWNTSAACGTNTTCSTTTVQCTSCTAPSLTCPGGLGAGTVNIASLPYNGVGLTNCGNGNNLTSTNAVVCGSSSYYGGEDKTFIFTPTVSGSYAIVLTTTSSWSGLTLYAGCPFLGQGGTCVAQSQSSSGNKTLTVTLTAGTTYYLVVDSWPSPNCHPSFNLSIAPPIPPCNAPGTPSASNIGSTSASVSWAAAPGTASYDWTLGTGASCPTGSGANTAATTVNLSGLTPNTTYRFCVRTGTCGGGAASSYLSSTFTTAPLPNDNCSGAISVSCNSTVTGSTVGATSDAAVGSCGVGTGGTPGNGIWYRLAGDGSQITLDLCASGYDTKVHVYSGACGALTCVTSNDDGCGLQSQVVFNTAPSVNYYILVNGFGSATGAFSMDISCACGVPLGAPWTTTGIGGASGQAIDNVCGGSIDLQSNGYSSSLASDKQYFASQTLCGNQTITVRVNNVTNGGFAGIAFRESSAPGSRLVALKTQLSTAVRREVRSTTNGVKNSQQLPAPGHSWLRITRNGNTFVGYHSQNGVNWQQAFVTTLALPSCVQVGMFVEGINVNSTAQGVFSNVSIGTPTLTAPVGAPTEVFATPLEFSLFPNPAQSEINVKMGEEFIGKEVSIRINNQLGQTLMVRRIGEVQHQIETIPVSELSHGVYFMSLQTSSGEVQTQKFVVGVNRP